MSKIKIALTSILAVCFYSVNAQSGWSQKMNFSSTAKVIGKVGTTADKISKVAPGLIGSTARVISKTAKSISSNMPAEANENKNRKTSTK